MRENIIKDKTYKFSLRIIKLYQYLSKEIKEFVIAKQILRSGTSIGANIEESTGAQSKKDFIAKFHIALKEAKETHYWLRLLKDSELIEVQLIDSFLNDLNEIITIITAILKSSKLKV